MCSLPTRPLGPRVARTKHAGMFDSADTLSTFDSNELSIESPAKNSLPSRLSFPYTPARELLTQNVAVTYPSMKHVPTATAPPPFSAGGRFFLRDFPPLVPARALCSISSPTSLRSKAASAADPSAEPSSQTSSSPGTKFAPRLPGRPNVQEPPAFTAASADTSPVALRAVSNSGEIRSRGLCPDAPVPLRTLTPGPSGPPTHLAYFTLVWHTLSANTQNDLCGVSPDQVAQGLELARFKEPALADEEHQRALEPLLQRADVLSSSETAARRQQEVHDSSAAAARRTAEMHEGQAREFRTRFQLVTAQRQTIVDDIANINGKHAARVAKIKEEPWSSSTQPLRTSSPPAVFIAPPAPLRQQNSALAPLTTATSVAPCTLPQRTAAAVTFAAAPVAAPAATMPPPTTTTPCTVVAARSRRQPRSSSAPTPDDSYLDLRVSKLMFENYRFPAGTRPPIKELATAVDRALSYPSGRKPSLRDAHRMATKDDTSFSARIVGDILRLCDLVRSCYATQDGPCWIQDTLRDAAAHRHLPRTVSSDSDSSAPGQRRREDPSSGRGNSKRATFPGTSDSDHFRRSDQDRRDRKQVHPRAPTILNGIYDAPPNFQQMADAISAATMAAVDRHLAHLGLYPRSDSAGLAPVAPPLRRTGDVDPTTHSSAPVQYSAAAPARAQYSAATPAPLQ